MKIKIYLNECVNGDVSIILQSEEFGWMEYYDNDDEFSPLTWKNKAELIYSTFGNTFSQKLRNFEKWNKLTYIGDL